MENAILISSIDKLDYLDKAPGNFSRVYFGSEFCDERIPTNDDLRDFLVFCENNGKEQTIIIPYLSQHGLERAANLLKFLDNRRVYPEILINDWGMLSYIPEKYGGKFPLVLGRILAKQKTGPRVELIKDIKPAAYESSKKSHVDIPVFIDFIKKKGVTRIELDMPLQGIDIKLPDNCGISLSLYHPYAYISTTRRCPVRETGECNCGNSVFRLDSQQMPCDLYNRGNTIFLKHDNSLRIPLIPQLDRLVFEPEVP